MIHNYVTVANSLTAQCIGPSTVVKIPAAALESCNKPIIWLPSQIRSWGFKEDAYEHHH